MILYDFIGCIIYSGCRSIGLLTTATTTTSYICRCILQIMQFLSYQVSIISHCLHPKMNQFLDQETGYQDHKYTKGNRIGVSCDSDLNWRVCWIYYKIETIRWQKSLLVIYDTLPNICRMPHETTPGIVIANMADRTTGTITVRVIMDTSACINPSPVISFNFCNNLLLAGSTWITLWMILIYATPNDQF